MKIMYKKLREILHYDPNTGGFTWLITRGGRAKKGTVAGWLHYSGYRCILVEQRTYMCHRLAWFYVCGEWPQGEIDHINCNKADNSFANLRLASRSQNCGNARKQTRVGAKGVQFVKAKKKYNYRARIYIDGKHVHLGYHRTRTAAHLAYLAAAKKHFGEFARAR